MFNEIIINSVGVFDIPLDINIKAYKQICIKDIDDICILKDYNILLYLIENSVHILAFDTQQRDSPCEYLESNSKDYSYDFANFIYLSNYYKIRFRSISYSLNNSKEIYIPDKLIINIYEKKHTPKDVYALIGDYFTRIGILSHLLYRFELNNYINNNIKKISI